ncbi:MAG: periplasmic heavy metal sensor [Bryobacteraceae bacterium]|nr:periplasmic heavy metal sensor [Bryobacteraceae bacterium]
MRVLLSLLFLLPGFAFAQPPRAWFPWWEGPLARDLNLTQEQRDKISAILREHRDKLIDQRAAVEKAEAEVDDLFNESELDDAKARPAIERLVEARSALTRTFTEMGLRLRRVLTAEQWKELQQKRSRWEPQFRRRMPRERDGGRPPGGRGTDRGPGPGPGSGSEPGPGPGPPEEE